MALQSTHRRKRTFRTMSCDGTPPLKPTNIYSLNKNKTRPIGGTKKNYTKTHKFKFNFKCDYIDNPKPIKRQRLSNELNQCNTKYKPTKHKTPILHHSIINERWNLLTNKRCKIKTQSNFPILNVLNELNNNTTNPINTNRVNNNTDISLIYSDDNDTESLNSYTTACDHYDDNDIPSISINDQCNNNTKKNININNTLNPWTYNINTINNININNNCNKYKWNEYNNKYINKRIETSKYTPSHPQSKSKDNNNNNNNNNSYIYMLMRLFFYILIIYLLSLGCGLNSYFNTMRKDKQLNESNLNNNSYMYVIIKWFIGIISVLIGLKYAIYKIFNIDQNNSNNNINRFKYDGMNNNFQQNVIVNNYYNNYIYK